MLSILGPIVVKSGLQENRRQEKYIPRPTRYAVTHMFIVNYRKIRRVLRHLLVERWRFRLLFSILLFVRNKSTLTPPPPENKERKREREGGREVFQKPRSSFYAMVGAERRKSFIGEGALAHWPNSRG